MMLCSFSPPPQALRNYGINPESVLVGRNAGLLSPFQELSSAQERQINGLVDDVYQDFLVKVALGRSMDMKKVKGPGPGRGGGRCGFGGSNCRQCFFVQPLHLLHHMISFSSSYYTV